MKTTTTRIAAILAAVMTTMMMSARTQDVVGKVTNQDGEPLAYVNVVLLSLPDSSFVQGAVTDEEGVFRIVTDIENGLLKLSSVGHETLYVKASNGLTIQLKEDAKLLDEVVVKGQLPRTHAKGDAMRTTVEGTILEKAGTITDALSKIPSLEAERDGGVKVLGRGDAQVYINGRRVQDMKELSRLRSDQIQHVDVVQNPGARYAASVKAVVRITLKKAQGEGFSFQDNAQGMYQYGLSATNNFVVNYRTGGLDVTGSFWVGTYGHSKSFQDNDLSYYAGPDYILARSTQESKRKWKGLSPQLQVNYMVDENHSFGAYYKFDRQPNSDFYSSFYTDNYENGIYIERSESRIWQDEGFSKHIFNAYYNGKVGQLGIDFNIDGFFDDTKSPGSTYEITKSLSEETSRSIESNTNSGNNFWASKLIISYPVWKGNISLGGEYSYNHRTDAYSYTATDYVPVKSTDTEIKEKSSSFFLEYGRQFGKIYTQLGLRYEHLENDYFNFGKREDEVCRNYADWFPTAVISVPLGKLQLSLSYRRDIERPHYGYLTSSTIYINRYTYQSGNPYLRPTYTHSFVFNAAYQWANLTLNYGRVKDFMTMSTEPFPGSDDPLVSLVHNINSEEDFNQFNIQLSARPVIGCWHPRWSVLTLLQDYKSLTATGSNITLNHPLFILGWQNDFELPHQFRLNVTGQWSSKGDYSNFRVTKTRLFTSIGVQKDLNLRRLGTLTIDLRCSDIFNTNKTASTIYGIREITSANPARRTFILDL
ncbi:MAG: TonB-dependent receptor, partial [Prevotella sp.]|nr:TonB-dependent receptor [Prevotella sp.]